MRKFNKYDYVKRIQGRSGPVLQSFVKDHGVVIKTLSDDVLTKFGNVAGEVFQNRQQKIK